MTDFFSEKQKKNIEFYEGHVNEYLSDDLKKNKFLVIHDERVKGIYDTFDAALQYAVANLPKNEFIIQQVIDNKDIVSYLKAAV